MEHIVVCIYPFLFTQEIGVYKNGKCIKLAKCKLTEIDTKCIELCKEYDIHQIDIGGSMIFALKIKDKIVNNKFDNFNINVDIH